MRSAQADPQVVYEVVTRGQRRTLGPGQRITIGRHASNDLALDDRSVSRFHARLDWLLGAPTPVVVDLGSLNGTFVGGERVLRAPLGEMAVFQVGSVEVAVALLHPALIPATGTTLLRMFDEWGPDEEGTIDDVVGVRQLLATLEETRRTVRVEVAACDLEASVVFAGGRVIQARVEAEGHVRVGRDALVHLLMRTPRARYHITGEVHPCEASRAMSVLEVLRSELTRAGPPAEPTARLAS